MEGNSVEFEKLQQIIADVLSVDVDEIKPETTFRDDLGADSLDVFQIIMGLEDIEKVLAAAPKATVIASHMDNVGHATVWRKDIREFAAQHGVTKRLLIPEDGETCCI